jgi:hypothetical protein
MRFLTSVSWTAAFLLLVFTPYSLASYGAGLPRLQHERRTIEKRTLFGSLNSLFSKRDDCATQYGPTYVDCGPRGCYQPSLGEICCGDESGMFPVVCFSLSSLCGSTQRLSDKTEQVMLMIFVGRLLPGGPVLRWVELLP